MEICVDDAKFKVDEGGSITQSHVIGNSCQEDITNRDNENKTILKYQTALRRR